MRETHGRDPGSRVRHDSTVQAQNCSHSIEEIRYNGQQYQADPSGEADYEVLFYEMGPVSLASPDDCSETDTYQ